MLLLCNSFHLLPPSPCYFWLLRSDLVKRRFMKNRKAWHSWDSCKLHPSILHGGCWVYFILGCICDFLKNTFSKSFSVLQFPSCFVPSGLPAPLLKHLCLGHPPGHVPSEWQVGHSFLTWVPQAAPRIKGPSAAFPRKCNPTLFTLWAGTPFQLIFCFFTFLDDNQIPMPLELIS